jgi:hypothetical protein
VASGSAVLAVLTSVYAGPRWAATAGGATGTIFQSAGLLAPFFLGLSVDLTHNYSLVWPILALPPLAGLVLAVVLDRIRIGLEIAP